MNKSPGTKNRTKTLNKQRRLRILIGKGNVLYIRFRYCATSPGAQRSGFATIRPGRVFKGLGVTNGVGA